MTKAIVGFWDTCLYFGGQEHERGQELELEMSLKRTCQG
jgi:hypothetical protein